jgi:xyloglucan-specific exo-beta-1,4-glucanase
VSPFTAGEIWVSGNTGIVHSTNYGATFTALATVTNAWGISAGAPKTSGGTAALFASATINGVNALYRTDDQTNWILISDATHGFGSANGLVVTADPRIYKRYDILRSLPVIFINGEYRVYVGTNGRYEIFSIWNVQY